MSLFYSLPRESAMSFKYLSLPPRLTISSYQVGHQKRDHGDGQYYPRQQGRRSPRPNSQPNSLGVQIGHEVCLVQEKGSYWYQYPPITPQVLPISGRTGRGITEAWDTLKTIYTSQAVSTNTPSKLYSLATRIRSGVKGKNRQANGPNMSLSKFSTNGKPKSYRL